MKRDQIHVANDAQENEYPALRLHRSTDNDRLIELDRLLHEGGNELNTDEEGYPEFFAHLLPLWTERPFQQQTEEGRMNDARTQLEP